MATNGKSENEIINAWQSLIEQSVKANTAFLEESAKLFSSLLSTKTEAKDLLKVNTEVLNAAANNFIRLNITNTENLMKFGMNISRSIFSLADKNKDSDSNSNPENETAEKQTGTVISPTRNQINLSAKQGEQITTSFYLNSHNAFAQTGKFNYGDFTDEANGITAALLMLISPKEFILEPAKSLKVDISIDATGNVQPGIYKSTVRLEGMDNQEFDIVVDVTGSTSSISKVSKHIPAVKNNIAKKALQKIKIRIEKLSIK